MQSESDEDSGEFPPVNPNVKWKQLPKVKKDENKKGARRKSGELDRIFQKDLPKMSIKPRWRQWLRHRDPVNLGESEVVKKAPNIRNPYGTHQDYDYECRLENRGTDQEKEVWFRNQGAKGF